jgi:glycosyltransferase involved in cell wall biosynthesis
VRTAVVIPSIGRPSLYALLQRLTAQGVPDITVVDDRTEGRLAVPDGVRVVAGPGRGPAAARNAGWRTASAEWIAFLDDDVLVTDTWYADLLSDLDQPLGVAGVQGRIEVPITGPRPSDREADTAKLASAHSVTADMAYRRAALVRVDGFDERFPRAYREDVDIAYRIAQSSGPVVIGRRTTIHPARDQTHWACLAAQRGNADDALLRRLYGPQWRRRLRLGRGRLPEYAALLAAAGAALALPRARRTGTAGVLLWAAGTALFTAYRVRQAPGERSHLPRLAVTSAAIPPLAIGHRVAGWWRFHSVKPWRPD